MMSLNLKNRMKESPSLFELVNKSIPGKDTSKEDRIKSQKQRESRWGIKVQSGAKLIAPPSYPSSENDYADPVNLAYPTEPVNRAKNALSRFSEFGKSNYANDPKGFKIVADRIAQAAINHKIKIDETSKILEYVSSSMKNKILSSNKKLNKESVNKLFKDPSPEYVSKMILHETDTDIVDSYVLEGDSIFKDYHPSSFGVSSWIKYMESFQKRHEFDFLEFCDLVKQNNKYGLHEHNDDNPDGGHYHSPDDTSDGSHEHTAANPFGLHSHKDGEVLGGAHTHGTNNKLGQHEHNEMYDNQGHTMADRSIQLVDMTKELEDVDEPIVASVIFHLQEIRWGVSCFLSDYNSISNDPDKVRKNNVMLGNVQLLYDDLRFITYVNSRISNPPPSFKLPSDSGETVEKGWYENDRNFSIQRVNRISKQLYMAKKMIDLLMKTTASRGRKFRGFNNNLKRVFMSIQLVQDQFESMLVEANDAGIINIADRQDSQKPVESLNLYKSNSQDDVEIELLKSADDAQSSGRIFCPIVKTIEGRITCVAMEPDTRDLHNQETPAPVIEKFMVNWMLNSQKLGYMHKKFNKKQALSNPDMRLTQCYIAPVDFTLGDQIIKKGSWVVEIKIFNKKLMKKVENGEITGISVGGRAYVLPDKTNEAVA